MSEANTCPACRRVLRPPNSARCPECGTAIGDGPKRRKKKKKSQPAGLSRKQITFIAVGVTALTLMVLCSGIATAVLLIRGGHARSGPLGSSGNFAVVDDLPDPPVRGEEAEEPELPESTQRVRMVWAAKPDPAANPIDYSNAFGGPTPEQHVLRAALDGPYVVGVPWLADSSRRNNRGKTGDPAPPNAPYRVVDIRTGKEVGSFPAAARLDRRSRLSSDGQYAAAWQTEVDQSARDDQRRDFLAVWKCGGDKPIVRWPVPARVLWIDFIGPDRIALQLTDEAPKFVVLDATKGTEIVSTPLPAIEFPPQDIRRRPRNRAPHFEGLPEVSGTVSPGGRYAVLLVRSSLVVLSTADGSVMGRLTLGDSSAVGELWAIGFDEIGGEVRAGYNSTLSTWSMTDGRVRHTVTLTNNPPRSCPLASGPEPDTLIFGGTIIDLVSGKPFFGLAVQALQWIKPDRLLAVAEPTQAVNAKAIQDSVDYKLGRGIYVVNFPREQYQSLAAPIIAARPKAPAGQPAAKPIDRASGAMIRPARNVAWTLKPSPAPPLAADAALSEWPDLFAVNETAMIQGTQLWTRHDLKSGHPIGEPIKLWPETRIPGERRRGRHAVLSPDGKRLAVVDPADPTHVGVWDASGKRLIDLFPCTNVSVHWLEWSADGRFLAACPDLTTAWDVATGKEVFEIDASYKTWQLAPGAAWFVAATPNGGLDFFDASSGKQLGHIRSGLVERGLFISPDGNMLARSDRSSNGAMVPLQIYDVETGRRSTAPESPMSSVFGQFIAPRRVLFTGDVSKDKNALLYDFDLHTHTYWFDMAKAPEIRADSFGRTWMKKAGEKIWIPVKIPGMEKFPYELAFGPGAAVRVEIDAGHGDYSQRAARQIAETLQRHGLKIGRNGWVLRAEHKIGKSSVKLNDPRSGAAVPNNFISLEINWKLLSPDGVEVWHDSNSNSFDPFRSKYVVVGSRSRPGPQGGIETVNLNFGGKDAVTAQIEELLEQTLLFPQYLPGMPLRVAKTADGYSPLPLQAKWDGQ